LIEVSLAQRAHVLTEISVEVALVSHLTLSRPRLLASHRRWE
jgi:hypothetical protein